MATPSSTTGSGSNRKESNKVFEFKYMGSKYRATHDLSLIERQNSMNGRWAQTDSLAVRAAAQEAKAKLRPAPML